MTDQHPPRPFHNDSHSMVPSQAAPQISYVMQDILGSGTHSDLLAAAQLLKSYNGALQHQVSRHQYAVHILQVLLKEQVMIRDHYHHHHRCQCQRCHYYCLKGMLVAIRLLGYLNWVQVSCCLPACLTWHPLCAVLARLAVTSCAGSFLAKACCNIMTLH